MGRRLGLTEAVAGALGDQTWGGVGRTPKWVQAILDERGIDMAAFKSIPMYRIHAPG